MAAPTIPATSPSLDPAAGDRLTAMIRGTIVRHRVRASYLDYYKRLATIKAIYDPTNFFRFNQNITPQACRTPGSVDNVGYSFVPVPVTIKAVRTGLTSQAQAGVR